MSSCGLECKRARRSCKNPSHRPDWRKRCAKHWTAAESPGYSATNACNLGRASEDREIFMEKIMSATTAVLETEPAIEDVLSHLTIGATATYTKGQIIY